MAQPRSTAHEEIARQIRRDILVATTAAGSGHATSSLSAVELMTALFFGGIFRADLSRPNFLNNDRLIISKGHAAPLLYALYAAAGRITDRELRSLRKFGSRLEGHPTLAFPYTEVPTGSLGQGLSVGVGMAIAARMDRLPYRTYVLLGDAEMSEGSVWEAIAYATNNKLDNLVGILDVNRLGQSGPTPTGWNLSLYDRRLRAFGWHTILVDGHDLAALVRAYREAGRIKNRPAMVIAKTVKGKGVSFLENRNGWHGKALSPEQLRIALAEIGAKKTRIVGKVAQPANRTPKHIAIRSAVRTLAETAVLSPREAFGKALVQLAPSHPELVVLDGDVKNSTYTEAFAKAFPKRFLEVSIAEQNMLGVANGLAKRGKLPLLSTFAAFFTRAFDQLRMAQYADTHIVCAGTHAGVSIGQDGPSQMGLEDIAMFRTLQNSTIFYPADAVATARLTERALKVGGIVYLRLGRNPAPTLYKRTATFLPGGSHTLRSATKDHVTIVAAGVTVFAALAAADELAKKKLFVRVIDLYSIKPIDSATLKKAARETKCMIVVEDHVAQGGIGEAVRSALGKDAGKLVSLAVNKIPKSGTPEQLLRYEGIDAAAIVRAALKRA